jgi:polyphosphate kinase 2
MPEKPHFEIENKNKSAEVESDLAGDAQTHPNAILSDSQTRQDTQLLIEENQHLRDKIKQLENLHKKAVRKYSQVQELRPYQAELIQLQQCLERRGKKMIIIFEGRGGVGKGGAIRRIIQFMNAKHYRVVALAKPTAEERSQWFYQKYVREFPRAGDMLLFHRSWYTRALIEPIFDFCTDREYKDFMEGVGGFEMDLVNQDIILVKLYLSVSREERARRFEQRRDDPLQRWKLNEIDLEAEERHDEFTEAKYEMLRHTHTLYAPWTIIRSDSKHQARLNAMKVILSAVDYERLDPDLDITPDRSVAISGAYELERIEAMRLRQGKLLGSHAAYLGSGGNLTRPWEDA